MHKFILYLIIILNTSLSHKLFGQAEPSMVRFDIPSFVSINKNFTSSIVFKFKETEAKSLEIKFHKPKFLKINSAVLKVGDITKNINLVYGKYDKNDISITLKLEGSNLLPNEPYQINLDCISQDIVKFSKKSFYWLKNESIKNSKSLNNDITENKILETEIYEPQKISGSCIHFEKNSCLKTNLLNDDDWNNIYIEFWVKSNKGIENYFTIEKPLVEDTLLSVSENELGFVAFPLNNNEQLRNDVYLGKNVWNYIGIKLSKSFTGLECKVYVNADLAYSFVADNYSTDNLRMIFSNSSNDANYEIDRFKIWKFDNNIDLALNNIHFLSFEADSSKVIYQNNFDITGEFNSVIKNSNFEIEGKNLQYKKSDAPLFSKAPKLTVNIGSTYNSIVWYVQEYSVAKEFVIERAISNGEFQSVFRTLADDDPLKIYYFTDELIDESEVVFYRVLQINRDGSEVYSPEVKIGNKEIQEFTLSQNYPNPFNPITSIYVEVIIPTEFKVNVYDLVGNKVAQLHHGYLTEGMHTFEFDGSSLPSGIYFYEVISPKSQIVKKMILAK